MAEFDPRAWEREALPRFFEQYAVQLDTYNRSLYTGLEHLGIVEDIHVLPLDHTAFKCRDSYQYESLRELLLKKADTVTAFHEIAMPEGRRIGAVVFDRAPWEGQITRPLCHPDIDRCTLLELIEPRPKRAMRDVVGLDHVEFIVPSPVELWEWTRWFEESDIMCELEANPRHAWLSVPLLATHRQGREFTWDFEFTDVPLMKIVEYEVMAGRVTTFHGQLPSSSV